MTHYGLVAGLRLDEMIRLTPGEVCDLYIMRVHYDDEQHGISRSKKKIYD